MLYEKGLNSWYSSVKYLSTQLDLKDSQCSFKNPKFEKITKNALNDKFKTFGEQKLSFSDGKKHCTQRSKMISR